MRREAFKELVKKYADDKPICNCGQAYLTACGQGCTLEGYTLVCKAGCSAAQIDAKDYVAKRVLQDLSKL